MVLRASDSLISSQMLVDSKVQPIECYWHYFMNSGGLGTTPVCHSLYSIRMTVVTEPGRFFNTKPQLIHSLRFNTFIYSGQVMEDDSTLLSDPK